VARCEAEVQQLTRANAIDLARREHDRGLEAVRRVRALTGELRQALAAVRAPEPNLIAIATSVHGALNAKNVWTDARVAELERALEAADFMLPARIPVMTPYVDDPPPQFFLMTNGDWIPAGSAGQVELAEQPEPIEPSLRAQNARARRRISLACSVSARSRSRTSRHPTRNPVATSRTTRR
jgi:hypothetical protein